MSPGRNTILKGVSTLPKIVHDFFETKDDDRCATTGAFYYCKKTALFLELITYICGKTPNAVIFVKINADEGQGRLQVLVQLIYDGDDDIGGINDTSGDNVFLLATAAGMKETNETVTTLMDLLKLHEVGDAFRNAEVVFCCDMKMVNLLVGIGPHSCRYPMALTLYSQNPKHSKPEVMRSVTSLNNDYEKYKAAQDDEEKRRAAAEDAGEQRRPKTISDANFNSVRHKMCDFLLTTRQSLMTTLMAAPLHHNLGIGAYCVKKLSNIDDDLLCRLMSNIGIRPEDRHGGISLVGNDVRRLFANAYQLMELLPVNQRRPLTERQQMTKATQARLMRQRLEAARATVKRAAAFEEAADSTIDEALRRTRPLKRDLSTRTEAEHTRKKLKKAVYDIDTTDDDDWQVTDDGDADCLLQQLTNEKEELEQMMVTTAAGRRTVTTAAGRRTQRSVQQDIDNVTAAITSVRTRRIAP